MDTTPEPAPSPDDAGEETAPLDDGAIDEPVPTEPPEPGTGLPADENDDDAGTVEWSDITGA